MITVLMSMILRNSDAYTTVYGPTVTLLETFFVWIFFMKCLVKDGH